MHLEGVHPAILPSLPRLIRDISTFLQFTKLCQLFFGILAVAPSCEIAKREIENRNPRNSDRCSGDPAANRSPSDLFRWNRYIHLFFSARAYELCSL